jgi:hypothetical protein
LLDEHEVGVTRLRDAVKYALSKSDVPLTAFWCKVDGDRESYAASLRKELEETPVAVLIVRGHGFVNPNAVQDDLRSLVELNRHACEPIANRLGAICGPGLVLLARTALGIPQVSSPVTFPEWFPRVGGTTVPVQIVDLTWTADAPLSAPEARCPEIAELLFAVEGALLHRLETVRQRDHNASSALVELIRRDSEERLGLAELVSGAIEFRTTVSTPASFRPSLREGRSLVARLWGVVQSEPPERLGRSAKALACALDLEGLQNCGRYESLATVLRRPTSPDPTPSRRSARNLLVTIASGCQLLTAAAHADDYSRYSVVLLRSTSFDLRLSLDDAERSLRSADEGRAVGQR